MSKPVFDVTVVAMSVKFVLTQSIRLKIMENEIFYVPKCLLVIPLLKKSQVFMCLSGVYFCTLASCSFVSLCWNADTLCECVRITVCVTVYPGVLFSTHY